MTKRFRVEAVALHPSLDLYAGLAEGAGDCGDVAHMFVQQRDQLGARAFFCRGEGSPFIGMLCLDG
jgi:hypothetical protein